MSIWIAQLILAARFLLHGLMLLALPTTMRRQMASLPGGPPFFRFIGLAELLAAAGLTLPTWTGILPWLTPLAAAGQLVIMVGRCPASAPRRVRTSRGRFSRPGIRGRCRLPDAVIGESHAVPSFHFV